jgi:hypothetical protein
MSRIHVKRPKPTAFVDVAVGRMAPLQEPPKEPPESMPSCYGRAKAYPSSTTTAVCSIATEGIAANPANAVECNGSTASMSPAELQAAQNAANSVPGPRFVPGRSIPVPNTASPEFQQTIAAPYRVPAWDADPKTSAEWKALVDRLADETVLFLPNRRLPHLEISAPSWLQMPETPLR